MQQKYRLIVSDIDGTITDKHGAICSADDAAITRVHESGVKMALSTERAAKGATQIVLKLPGNGLHIFFDGALGCDSSLDKIIYDLST